MYKQTLTVREEDSWQDFFFQNTLKIHFTVSSSEFTPAMFLKISHSSLIVHTQCQFIM